MRLHAWRRTAAYYRTTLLPCTLRTPLACVGAHTVDEPVGAHTADEMVVVVVVVVGVSLRRRWWRRCVGRKAATKQGGVLRPSKVQSLCITAYPSW